MMNMLFERIGKKCKMIATIVCGAGIALSVIIGILMMVTMRRMVIPGLMFMVIMSLVSWLSSLSLYAIGEAADKSAQAETMLSQGH